MLSPRRLPLFAALLSLLAACDDSGGGLAADVSAETTTAADAVAPDGSVVDDSVVTDTAGPEDSIVAADTSAPADIDLGRASVSGYAFNFAPGGGMVAGATVRVAELPGRETMTNSHGRWELEDLPVGARLSFTLAKDTVVTSQTATLEVAPEGLEAVTFQSPTHDLYGLMASAAQITPDPEMCQIAATVTRRGYSVGGWSGTHGEPGATVTLDPPLPAAHGPVYFNLISFDVIYPDVDLEETTDDGGVLFLNVPPGEYTLRAHKDGATFTDRLMRCRAGSLVNAAPPWGLQVLTGGVEPNQ